MQALDHPHIVKMYAVGLKQRPWLIVEELCLYGDLDEVLMACRDHGLQITLAEKLNMAYQVACALEYMSGTGYLHVDVAARNCLMHSRNVVKIAGETIFAAMNSDFNGDLGSARRLPEGKKNLQLTQPLKVSPRWLAPEAHAKLIISEKTDVGQTCCALISLGQLGLVVRNLCLGDIFVRTDAIC